MNSLAWAQLPENMVGSFPSNLPFPWGTAVGCGVGAAPPPLPPPPAGLGTVLDGGGPECEVRVVAIVDCVGVMVTADILLGTSGMLVSLS